MAVALDVENQLAQEGYSQNDIADLRVNMQQQLHDEGYSTTEINKLYGIKEPDMAPVKTMFNENLKTAFEKVIEVAEGEKPKPREIPEAREPTSFIEALEAGWQMSVSGLIARQELPGIAVTEDTSMFYNIVSQAGTLAGDVPFMVAGAGAGGSAGAATGAAIGTLGANPVTVAAGAIIGAGAGATAGAFAAPAGMRKLLMDQYEKGDIQTFSDFWERSSAVFLETAKAGTVGLATAGAGGVVGKIGKGVLQPLLTGTAKTSAEIGAMVSVGSALEGEMPDAKDFLEAGILLGGIKGSVLMASKMRNIYSKANIKPEDAALQTIEDPITHGEMGSKNIEIPAKFDIEPTPPKPKAPIEKNANLEQAPDKFSKEFISEKEGVNVEPLPIKTIEPVVEVEPKAGVIEGAPKVKTSQEIVSEKISFEGVKEKTQFDFDEFYTKYVDDLHPINKLTRTLEGKEVPAAENPYILARLTRGDFGRADQMIEIGPFDFKTKKTVGPGVRKILEPVKGDLEAFEAFAVSERVLELEKRGVKHGIDLEAAKEVSKTASPKMKKAFKELVQYQNNVLTYLKDSGVISEKAFKSITEANKSYVPFFRVADKGSTRGAGAGLKVKNPIKGIKGSEKDIVSPLESIIKNTYLYSKLAERNRVMTKLVELAEKNPEIGKELVQKQKVKFKPTKVSEAEMKKFFEQHGIEADPEVMTVFRPRQEALRPDEIAVYKDGKRQTFKVPEDVSRAINALDEQSMNMLIKFLAIPARSLRAGVTLTPEFAARNFIRDQTSAVILSKSGFVPVYDSLSGLGSLFKKDKIYQDWLKNGGANSAIVSLDRAYIKEKVFNLSKDTGLIDKTWNVVKTPLEMARVLSEVIENSTRIGEFKRARSKGATPEEAAFRAREVTLDFARMGTNIRAMNMITAFMNVGIQGIDRTARAFKEAPMGTTLRVSAAVTLPSVMLWWANKDDPRWREIPRWQKDLFWLVMTEDTVYRIPKPFELGILFGSLPERSLEAFFTDNPNAFADFNETLVEGAVPSYLPTFTVPIIEHFANKSTFTGRPIVPFSTEGLLPEYQYSEYTTETSKAISNMIAAVPGFKTKAPSPAVLDNYIRAWTGGVGQYALQLADAALIKAGVVQDPIKPEDTLADIPVVKAFVIRHPSATAQSIQDFYDNFSENQQVISTIRFLAKQGDFENLQKELNLEENSDKLINLQGIKQALSTISKMVRMVNKNPDFTPPEKRQMIDGLYNTMILTAKRGNMLVRELDEALKAK